MSTMLSRLIRRPGFWGLLILSGFAALFVTSSQDASPASAGTGLVPDSVRTDVPVAVDGTVFDLEQMGDRIVVSGSFTQIQSGIGAATINQKYLFAYDIDSGELDRNFLLDIDREVEQIIPAPDGSALYIVGRFNTIDGQKARKIARITADGQVDTSFKANADSKVSSVAISPDGTRLFVGGRFSSINGVPRAGLAELDATTGAVADGFQIGVSTGIGVGGSLTVKGLDVTPDGRTLVALTTARFVDDQERWGPATIDISGATATLTPWRTTLFEDNRDRVGGQFWFRGFDTSPDGTYFVITTSGGDRPPTNDVAVRFPIAGGDGVEPDWITRNFDSTYAAAIDDDVVYIGGHFRYTEAPGAPNPWPGDADISFGWGGDRVASELGDDVIARYQIAALDPATGHTLNWNPGANGWNGVYELEVIDRGLLLGHDGDTVADKKVGRSGFFDRANPGNGNAGGGDAGGGEGEGGGGGADIDAATIDTKITSLTDGDSVATGRQDLSGVAAAPDGIDRVQVTVYDLARKTWLQADGTFDSAWVAHPATLDAPKGSTTTNWTLPINLPRNAEYEIKAKVIDQQKGKDPDQASIRVRAGAPLDTEITSPLTGAEFATGTTTLEGRATAPEGIAKVQVTVFDLGNRTWLQPDGSFAADWASTVATLDAPAGATAAGWTLPVDFGRIAEYEIKAKVFDQDGAKDATTPRIRVKVTGGEDDLPPNSWISAATANVDDSTITAVGGVSDDFGVQSVGISVLVRDRDADNTQYLQTDGSLGDFFEFPAELDNIGTPGANWTVTLPLPDIDGRVLIESYATDIAGQRDPSRAARWLTIGEGAVDEEDEPPAITIDSPAREVDVAAGQPFVISGVLTDDTAAESVSVSITNVTTGQGLQLGGAIAGIDGRASAVAATLANPGAASSVWSLDVPALPPGRYVIRANGADDAGQRAGASHAVNLRAADGDQFPSSAIGSPLPGTQGDGTITPEGAAFDDNGVSRVEVAFYFYGATGERRGWLQEDDTTITGLIDWRDASLATPGAADTDWSLPSIDLPKEGRWQIRVRTWDSRDQPGSTYAIQVIDFGEPETNEAPTLEILSIATNDIVPAGPLAVTGVIRDDAQVQRVRFLVRRAYVNEGPNLDPNIGTAGWFEGFVTQPGGERSNFAFTTEDLPTGRWNLYVGGYDNTGKYTQTHVTFTVGDSDNVAPDTSFTAPANGSSIASLTTVVEGIAADDSAIDEVSILVYDFTRRRYIAADGTLTGDPSKAYRTATLASPGSKRTEWSHTVTATEPGQYQVHAFTHDDDGMRQLANRYIRFWLTGGDAFPVAEVASPEQGAVVAPGAVNISGTVTDDLGIDRVAYYIQRTNVNEGPNLNPFLTTAGWFDMALTAEQRGATSVPVDIDADLEPGAYLVYVDVYDTAGKRTRVRRDFTVNVADNAAPDTRLVSPANGSADQDDLNVEVVGTATDDSGVAEVRILVYNFATRRYLAADGTTTSEPARAYRIADVATVGATSTDWTASFEVPEGLEGYYQVQAFAYDTDGMVQVANRYHRFHVTPGDTVPEVSVTSPVAASTVAPGTVRIEGVATDDVGVQRLQYYVQRTNVNEGPNPSPFLSHAGWFDLPLTDDEKGAGSLPFNIEVDLAPGAYLTYVQVTDTGGKTKRIRHDFTVNVSDNAAPDTGIVSPKWNSNDQDDLDVEVIGTATDDSGVVEVRILVYDWANRRFLTPAGTLTNEPATAYHAATLDNAGATSTDWTASFQVPEGAEGYYQVQSFAYDSDGMVQVANRYVRFHVTPEG